jgi:hypothetical protein
MVTDLKGLSQPVKGDMIAQVGIISANNDQTIGKIIAEAMEKVGKDGVIRWIGVWIAGRRAGPRMVRLQMTVAGLHGRALVNGYDNLTR